MSAKKPELLPIEKEILRVANARAEGIDVVYEPQKFDKSRLSKTQEECKRRFLKAVEGRIWFRI